MTEKQNEQEWKTKIEKFKKSGLTQTQWCKEKGINLRNFNRWYNLLKNQVPNDKKKTNWIPLKIEKKDMNLSLNIKIGKATIEVPEEFNRKLLSDIIQVVIEIC